MAAQKTHKDFNKICRACLEIKKDMRPLFEQLTATMLMGISKVQVAMGDGLPKKLCLQCVHQISRYHAFKEMVERNDVTLHEQAKRMAQEAIKNSEQQQQHQQPPQYIPQYMELPIAETPAQLLEGFFTQPDPDVKEIQVEQTTLTDLKPIEQPQGKEDDLNSDEESYLQMVVFQATSTVSPGRHVCNLCHKEFKHSRWLKMHMRSHSNWIKANCKKPPMCNICDRTFKGPGMLRMHMRTHEASPVKQPTKREPGPIVVESTSCLLKESLNNSVAGFNKEKNTDNKINTSHLNITGKPQKKDGQTALRIDCEPDLNIPKQELWPKGVVYRKFRGRFLNSAQSSHAPTIRANKYL